MITNTRTHNNIDIVSLSIDLGEELGVFEVESQYDSKGNLVARHYWDACGDTIVDAEGWKALSAFMDKHDKELDLTRAI